jgi:glutamine phosphoribosylpyrophosphate amidotransferase
MLPDVTGFTLGEAVGLLEAAGVTGIDIRITAPPREKDRQYGSDSRVVRQIVCCPPGEGMSVELIVCNP